MKIIPAIKSLQAAVRAATITGGVGVNVEHTPSGTRLYLPETSGGDGGAWHGMFELRRKIEAEDGVTTYAVRVVNGNDLDGTEAGIAHVNRQPFAVLVTELAIVGTARHYIYLQFDAPVEATDMAPAIPAAISIAAKTTLQESTGSIVYHLLGQAWREGDLLLLSQDHIPGNVFIDWYGPCLGLLEEDDV